MVEVLHGLFCLRAQAEGLTRGPYCGIEGRPRTRCRARAPEGSISARLAVPDDPPSANWRASSTSQTSIASAPGAPVRRRHAFVVLVPVSYTHLRAHET